MLTKQLEKDLQYTKSKLANEEWKKLSNSVVLVTGGGGFIGFYLMHFLYYFKDELNLKRVICLDNFILGKPKWINEMAEDNRFIIRKFDIAKDNIEDIEEADKVDFIIHMASIASPTFYRQYPIVTLDANIWGLRSLLEYSRKNCIRGFLFFSSSEIYGNPVPEQVPTGEEYYGNVCVTGPRSCYDESKRFGETMCMLFAQEYNLPIGVVRPFNNFGPGMKINDKRVPADFALSVLTKKDIVIHSNGTPSRTFCYIADAVAGYLKILLHGKYDYFNIGIERPEISVKELAEIYVKVGKELFDYSGKVVYEISEDKDYLTNNPQRRCPQIDKAREILGYNPSIYVEEGIRRFMEFLSESGEDNKQW